MIVPKNEVKTNGVGALLYVTKICMHKTQAGTNKNASCCSFFVAVIFHFCNFQSFQTRGAKKKHDISTEYALLAIICS